MTWDEPGSSHFNANSAAAKAFNVHAQFNGAANSLVSLTCLRSDHAQCRKLSRESSKRTAVSLIRTCFIDMRLSRMDTAINQSENCKFSRAQRSTRAMTQEDNSNSFRSMDSLTSFGHGMVDTE